MDLDTPWHGVGQIMLISLEVQRTIERTDMGHQNGFVSAVRAIGYFRKIDEWCHQKKRAKWIASVLGMKARISGCWSGTKWMSAPMRG